MSRPTYDELLDEVLVLRSRLAELAAPDTVARIQSALGMTRTEAKVLACLYSRDFASRDLLYATAHEYENGDGPTIKIVDVYICKVRRKLRELGDIGKILTVWAQGYRLDPTLRAYLAPFVEEADQPQAIAA